MNIGEVKDWIGVFQIIITAVLAFVFWLLNRDKATNTKITKLTKEIDSRMDGIEVRQHSLEQQIKIAPSHEDIKNQYAAMARQTEKLDQLIGQMSARDKVLELIHRHLMSNN